MTDGRIGYFSDWSLLYVHLFFSCNCSHSSLLQTVAVFVLQLYTSRREVLRDIMTSPQLGNSTQMDNEINRKSSEDEARLSA